MQKSRKYLIFLPCFLSETKLTQKNIDAIPVSYTHLSWKESWVQAGIVVIYLASSFSGGRMAGNMAGKRRFLWGICFGIVYFAILIIVSAVFLPGGFAGAGRLLWAAAVCAVGGMAGGMTAHGR